MLPISESKPLTNQGVVLPTCFEKSLRKKLNDVKGAVGLGINCKISKRRSLITCIGMQVK